MLKKLINKRIIISGLFLLAGFSYAAGSAGETLKDSIRLMQSGQYEKAIDSMFAYLEIVSGSKTERVIAIAQDIRFKLATLLINQNRSKDAIEVLQTYLALDMREKPRTMMKMLISCQYDEKQYKDCITTIKNAFDYDANPEGFDNLISISQEGGGETEEMAEPEPSFTPEELTLLWLKLGECHYKLKQWEQCIEPYRYVIDNSSSEQSKGYAIMQIINALIKLSDYDRIMEWIPQLYRSSARYDIQVNLALMNVAKALYDEKRYDGALPLYRMIMPREELVAYQQERLKELRLEYGMSVVEDIEISAAEAFLFGELEPEKDAEKPAAVMQLEGLINTLKELDPYELYVQYQMANLYKTVERPWEAVAFFRRVYETDPTTDTGQRSIYELIDLMLNQLEEADEAQRIGFDYMTRYVTDEVSRQVAYLMTSYYQKNEEMTGIKAIEPYLNGLVRTNDTQILKYDTELYFMQAIADLFLGNYEASESGFKFVLDEFPGSHQESSSQYWYAMSQMILQKYPEALASFEKYLALYRYTVVDAKTTSFKRNEKLSEEAYLAAIRNYGAGSFRVKDGDYVDECQFQSGVCLFGLEQYTNALERFTYVIENYPDSPVFPDACSMRGDLYGSWGELSLAIADYERGFAAAKKVSQATYTTFQMAEIYEALAEDEGTYDDIIRVIEAYLERWPDEANIAKALFWIGKTKIAQEKVDEAVATYLDTIVTYGSDVKQDGVDMIIAELAKISVIYLDEDQQRDLRIRLQAAIDLAESRTLKMRLRAMLAKLERTEVELGRQLMQELPDLNDVPPPVLATICHASFEMEDYSRAEELLKIFTTQFEESLYMRAAYKLRVHGQYAENDLAAALETIQRVQDAYGPEQDLAWAQLMKARILLDQGKLEESREANMLVMATPTWRGEPVAQATYQLGQIAEKEGALDKAHAFYQRTYIRYPGFAGGHWAAEGYLAAARCLKAMGLEQDRLNTLRAMLYSSFVNTLPQADVARKALGAAETARIEAFVATGGTTNIAVNIESEAEKEAEPEAKDGTAAGENAE